MICHGWRRSWPTIRAAGDRPCGRGSSAAVADDTEADGLASPFDSILLDQEGGLPLRTVVEDEILSALPLAPVHADPSECKGASPVPLGAGTAPERQAHRPFERLGRLMGTGGSGESNE
jgi:uncharacterized metal-binding protein YceD (DUF177 family)